MRFQAWNTLMLHVQQTEHWGCHFKLEKGFHNIHLLNMAIGDGWRWRPFDLYYNSSHGDGVTFNLESAGWQPVSSLLVQRGSVQVAITSCYSIGNEKVKGQPLLPADDAWVSQGDMLKCAGSAGRGTWPQACTRASPIPCRQLSKSTRLEKFGQNQCGLLSALIKHRTEKGDPRSFYIQTSQLAVPLKLYSHLQHGYKWPMGSIWERGPVSCWDLGSP